MGRFFLFIFCVEMECGKRKFEHFEAFGSKKARVEEVNVLKRQREHCDDGDCKRRRYCEPHVEAADMSSYYGMIGSMIHQPRFVY